MIFGIGTDVVDVRRIASLHQRHPERFYRRILVGGELDEFAASDFKPAFLAKRFASKEAASKALGLGFQQGIRFTDFEVTHNALGRPAIKLHGKAAEMAAELGIDAVHLSISDEAHTAVAFVILERL